MQYTGNYNLKKPEGTDVVNIEDLNENADILDQKLKEVEDKADSAPAGIAAAQVVQDNLDAHEADTMPHRFVDGGVTYRWGLAVIDGVVNMVYEEVS